MIEQWAICVGQSVVLMVMGVVVFGGAVYLGHRLLSWWLG